MAVVLVAAAAAQNAGVTTPAATAAITPTTTTTTIALNPKQRTFVFQAHSCETGSVTPTDWNPVFKDVIIGTGTASAGAGRRFISCWYRDYDGVWTMPSFTLASATQNSHAIETLTVSCDPTETFDTPTYSGIGAYFGTAGTAFSAATPAAFNAVTGAFLIALSATNDNVTATSGAITGSGFTSGTVTERGDSGTATGNDVSIKVHTCWPTTGANVALTHTQTLSAASQGGWAAIQQTVTYGGSTPSGAFVYDNFRDVTAPVALGSHTGEVGATWTSQTGWSGIPEVSGHRLVSGNTEGHYYASGTPASADYIVKSDVYIASALGWNGVLARVDPAAGNTYYSAFIYQDGKVYLERGAAGADVNLGNVSVSSTVGTTHNLAIKVEGTSISAYWDDVLVLGPYTDATYASAGKAGIICGGSSAPWYTVGIQLNNLTALPSATAYTADKTEPVGITDSLTNNAGREATDAVGITDSVTKDVGRTATDLVGVTDSASTVQDWARSQTDLVGVTDSVTTTQDWVRSQTDPVGVTDSAEFSLAYFADATDAVGVTDSVGSVQDWDRPQTDLVGITDSAAFSLGFSAAATDPVGVSDSVTVQQDWSRSQTDPVGVTDALAKDAGRTATDPVGITDTAATTQDWVRVQTDLVGVTDSYVSGLGRLATDTVGATDSFSVVQAWVRSTTDSVGVTDSESFDLAAAGDVADTDQVGISDTLGTASGNVRSDDDEVGVSDSALFAVGSVAGSTDTVGITDLLSVIAAYERSWTDPVGVADDATFDLSSAGDIAESDSVGVTDSFDLAAYYERSFTDPVGVLDDAQFQLDVVADEEVDATDLVGVVDAAFFAMLLPPGPLNTWVVPSESVRHSPKTESVRHAGAAEPVGYALTKETNTYALKAESTHSEVIG